MKWVLIAAAVLCSASAFAQTQRLRTSVADLYCRYRRKGRPAANLLERSRVRNYGQVIARRQNFDVARPQQKRTSPRLHKQLVQFQPVRSERNPRRWHG